MIVCMCNAMTDGAVREAIASGASRPKEVYECCGGRAQCGCCTQTIVSIIREDRPAR